MILHDETPMRIIKAIKNQKISNNCWEQLVSISLKNCEQKPLKSIYCLHQKASEL